MHVIITGSLFSGFSIVGPFEDKDAALAYAERYVRGGTFWELLPLEEPIGA